MQQHANTPAQVAPRRCATAPIDRTSFPDETTWQQTSHFMRQALSGRPATLAAIRRTFDDFRTADEWEANNVDTHYRTVTDYAVNALAARLVDPDADDAAKRYPSTETNETPAAASRAARSLAYLMHRDTTVSPALSAWMETLDHPPSPAMDHRPLLSRALPKQYLFSDQRVNTGDLAHAVALAHYLVAVIPVDLRHNVYGTRDYDALPFSDFRDEAEHERWRATAEARFGYHLPTFDCQVPHATRGALTKRRQALLADIVFETVHMATMLRVLKRLAPTLMVSDGTFPADPDDLPGIEQTARLWQIVNEDMNRGLCYHLDRENLSKWYYDIFTHVRTRQYRVSLILMSYDFDPTHRNYLGQFDAAEKQRALFMLPGDTHLTAPTVERMMLLAYRSGDQARHFLGDVFDWHDPTPIPHGYWGANRTVERILAPLLFEAGIPDARVRLLLAQHRQLTTSAQAYVRAATSADHQAHRERFLRKFIEWYLITATPEQAEAAGRDPDSVFEHIAASHRTPSHPKYVPGLKPWP